MITSLENIEMKQSHEPPLESTTLALSLAIWDTYKLRPAF